MESIWHLRPDARWSDGVPVTAEDFIFTYQLIQHPDVPAVSREVENRIVRMEARHGSRTLVVLWKNPYAFAQEGHLHLVIPRHIEEPVFQGLADKKAYERTPFNRRPVGNGPYQVEEWAFGRYIILKKQPYWHGARPFFEQLVYRFLPEGDTVLANLNTGRIGAVSPLALDPDLVQEYAQHARTLGNEPYDIVSKPGLAWVHIDFNTENPTTEEKRVRQALALGLDRKGLSELLFPGQNCATDTWLPRFHPCCFPPPDQVSPDLPRYPYDPMRADQLLEAAGWHRGPSGYRIKEGQVFRIKMRYVAGETLTDRVAQMVKEDWRKRGIDLLLQPEEVKKFSENTAENRAFQGLSLYPWYLDSSADGIPFWTTSSIPTNEKPTGQNACRWRNARSDQLLFQVAETLDHNRRRELLWEQQRIWAEELPAIPLFFQPEISIRHRRLDGWKPTGTDTPVTWNCAEWRWKK
jgi:peptide/nickel transport system substrate-binding protein